MKKGPVHSAVKRGLAAARALIIERRADPVRGKLRAQLHNLVSDRRRAEHAIVIFGLRQRTIGRLSVADASALAAARARVDAINEAIHALRNSDAIVVNPPHAETSPAPPTPEQSRKEAKR